jgi:hypothetical protein
MKSTWWLLVASAVALLACTDTATSPPPTGGSAGTMGADHCDSPPADPAAIEAWNQRCLP